MVFKEMQEPISFRDILVPYTDSLLDFIAKLDLSESKKSILFNTFLKELSSDAEIVLQYELDKFRKTGNNNFEVFVIEMQKNLSMCYPVLDKIFKDKATNFLNHLSKIISRFQKDIKKIITTFGLPVKEENLRIIDIETNLGDGHNGEGTALLLLSNGIKLIYKPRNIEIINSYNSFICWVNHKANIDLKVFKSLNCIKYGWLEFVNHKEVNSEEDLSEYYYKAGALLMITALLGSIDCHSENIIASGKNPIMIDHETIIQPLWKNRSVQIMDEQNEICGFSVLENNLIFNHKISSYPDCTGYGIQGLEEVSVLSKKIINPNTINSKRVTEITNRSLIQKNIPKKCNTYIFVNDYKKYFLKGFCTTYDMFLSSKSELNGITKDIFSEKKVRAVWRPTFVYVKILKYLTNIKFMSSFEAYHIKLTELLSYAYRSKHMEEYRSLLDAEIKQMLKGDVPIFSVCSSERFLENDVNFRGLQYDCTENIHHRINLLSEEHKQKQIKLINNWIDISKDSINQLLKK